MKVLVIAAVALGLSASVAMAQRRLPPTRLVPAPEAPTTTVNPSPHQEITCMDLQQYCYQWEYMYETSSRTVCETPKHDGLEPCPKPTKQQLDASVDSHLQVISNGTLASFKSNGWQALVIFHGMSDALWAYEPFDPFIARDSCRAVCQDDPSADSMPTRLKSYIDQQYGNSTVQ